MKEPSWFEEQGIEVMLDTVSDGGDEDAGLDLKIGNLSSSILDYQAVVRVEPMEKKIYTEKSQMLEFDFVFLATGKKKKKKGRWKGFEGSKAHVHVSDVYLTLLT